MSGTGMSPGEPAPEEAFSLEEGQARSEEIEENLTWEGMPRIGYLKEKEWRLRGPKGHADKVKPYVQSKFPIRCLCILV